MHQVGKPKPNELRCSTLSMMILLLFNDGDIQSNGITVKQIMEKISIDEETCRKNLASLSYQKSKVLTITKMGAKETPT